MAILPAGREFANHRRALRTDERGVYLPLTM